MEKTGNSTVLMLGVAGMGLALAMFIDAMKMKDTSTPAETKVQYTEPIEDDFEHVGHITPLVPLYDITEEVEEDVLSATPSERSSHTESSKESSSKSSSKESSNTQEVIQASVQKSVKASDKATHGEPDVDFNVVNELVFEEENTPVVHISSSVSEPPLSKKKKKKKRSKVLTPGPDMTTQERIDYKKFYKNKKRAILEEYVSKQPDNSYKGDGTPWSKRMYFIKEAYRRSRESTPVVYSKPQN